MSSGKQTSDVKAREMNLASVPKIELGQTGIVSTILGLGAGGWPLKASLDQAIEVFRTAFALGIRHVDTAPLYDTEETVGRVLLEIDVPDDVVLVAKTGHYWDVELNLTYFGFSYDSVMRSVERSLKRLNADFLHILFLHDVKPEHLPEVFAEGGAVSALQELKSQGVIGAIGMATGPLECQLAAIDSGAFDVIQSYHAYTLLNDTAAQNLIPQAKARGLALLNAGPFAGHILATGPVPGAGYNYAPASTEIIASVRKLERACQRKGVTLAHAALAFALANPDIGTTIVGSGNPGHIQEWVRAIDTSLSDDDFRDLIGIARGPFPTHR